ncbi:hypothetical protein [uncultured Limosilactobacillus sp.]|uniref:hypothetical protein n=1 Tax=uncultured Limosilactobacillus sp. TaxID=2837629 RepID=UPI0025844EC7|nr:hypothetical protein [uncultured Limosilactobacillus sp.]
MSERKVAIITGGSRGIGAAMVDKLGDSTTTLSLTTTATTPRPRPKKLPMP